MNEAPMKVVVDAKAKTTKYIPLSAEEITERDEMAAQAELDRQAKEAAAQALADLKASAKAKLVAGEPLTAEEADTLVI